MKWTNIDCNHNSFGLVDFYPGRLIVIQCYWLKNVLRSAGVVVGGGTSFMIQNGVSCFMLTAVSDRFKSYTW